MVGEIFAYASHLEAASVFAFERMERELKEHRAPASLRTAAQRSLNACDVEPLLRHEHARQQAGEYCEEHDRRGCKSPLGDEGEGENSADEHHRAGLEREAHQRVVSLATEPCPCVVAVGAARFGFRAGHIAR